MNINVYRVVAKYLQNIIHQAIPQHQSFPWVESQQWVGFPLTDAEKKLIEVNIRMIYSPIKVPIVMHNRHIFSRLKNIIITSSRISVCV